MTQTFREFVDRVYIINLPERADRRASTLGELRDLGFPADDPKIEIPFAPRPVDANQFASRGVHGNFLSHVSILKDAREKGYRRIMVLEDDAIFSKRMVRTQKAITGTLLSKPWDLYFLGHSLKKEIADAPDGLVETRAEFMWMHCFMVNHTIYDRLIAYLEESLERPAGDPRGGRMYIDGAYNMFRRLHPDVVSYVHKPMLSAQRGDLSSLGRWRWYDMLPFSAILMRTARTLRDEAWKRVVY